VVQWSAEDGQIELGNWSEHAIALLAGNEVVYIE
jgi:hypothetical protein